jgi:hypothetical protein
MSHNPGQVPGERAARVPWCVAEDARSASRQALGAAADCAAVVSAIELRLRRATALSPRGGGEGHASPTGLFAAHAALELALTRARAAGDRAERAAALAADAAMTLELQLVGS